MEATKVILSLSGGLDSTMLMLYYLNKGYEVHGVSFKYGQKHAVELQKVQNNVKFLQERGLPVTHQIVDLTTAFAYSASSLHQGGEEIPTGHYADENMKSTVVENRNVIFSSIVYGIALGIAKKEDRDVIISQGVHAGDHTIYPDCRPESVAMARELYRISNWDSERVDFETPFVLLDKGQVLREGINAMMDMGFQAEDFEYVLENTHTCYNPDSEGRACGRCGSCTERLEAFASNDLQDPAAYQG